MYLFRYIYIYYKDMSKGTYLQIPSSEPEPLESSLGGGSGFSIWEFPKIGGTLFWCPYKKDPTI